MNKKKSLKRVVQCGLILTSVSICAQIENIERISINNIQESANADSRTADISGDGNLVVFSSTASNLVDGDDNSSSDIFVYNRNLATIKRISIGADGSEANRSSIDPKISRNGRFVAFKSGASNLVANDTNGRDDVFLHDLMLGTTELVSLSALNNQAPSGAFLNDISADGQRIVFLADFQDSSDTTADQVDVWLRDINTQSTILISQSSSGEAANQRARSAAINGTGDLVAFVSLADNLVPQDSNSLDDVFLRDTTTNQTSRVSLTPSGQQLETGVDNSTTIGGLSDDGRYVVFQMAANDLLDPEPSTLMNRIIRHDRQTGHNEFISIEHSNDNSFSPSISADGNIVTYHSPLDFFSTEAEVYARQVNEEKTLLVSQNLMGASGNDSSFRGVVSDNGQFVSFISAADNLIENDDNARDDVFVAQLPISENLVVPGLYFDPTHNGHGFSIEKVANTEIYFTVFYTYQDDGTPEWYTAQSTMENNVLTTTVLNRVTYDYSIDPVGNNLPLIFDESINREITIDFNESALNSVTCNAESKAVSSWKIGQQSGDWCIQPIDTAIGSPPMMNDLGGTWWTGIDDDGWGLSMSFTDTLILVTIYYFDAEGNPRWVQGNQVGFEAGKEISLNMLEFEGYARDETPPANFNVTDAGTLSLIINDNTGENQGSINLDINYQGSEGGSWIRSNVPISIITQAH